MSNEDRLLIAEGGQSSYRIAISESASPSEQRAAGELQRFLEEICGAQLEVVEDTETPSAHEILLGSNRHLEYFGMKFSVAVSKG